MNFKNLMPEDFEYLVEDVLKLKGFSITSRPGRGPDRAKDLTAERLVTSDMRITTKEVWLVQCKHLAKSNKAVTEKDIPNFKIRAAQHGANRYLLATTTIASEGIKDLFDTVNSDEKSGLKCAIFNKYDLSDYIKLHPELFDKYFNVSNNSMQDKAKALISFLRKHHFEVHRGAILYDKEITAVFGNDGYNNEKTQQSIRLFRDLLKQEGVQEIVISEPDNTGSWCMFIQSDKAEYYHNKIWEFYPMDEIYKNTQKESNWSRLWTHWTTPFIDGDDRT